MAKPASGVSVETSTKSVITGEDVTVTVERDRHGTGTVTVRTKSTKSPGASKAKRMGEYLVKVDGFLTDYQGRGAPCVSNYHFKQGLSDAVLKKLVALAEDDVCPGCGWPLDCIEKTSSCALGKNCKCGSMRQRGSGGGARGRATKPTRRR
jgi:hypothetical protein